MNHTRRFILTCAAAVLVSSCSTLKLDRVDFGWPVESAVTVNNANIFEDVRYSVTGGVSALAMEEFQDSTALKGANLRLIRSSEGYYFVTGPRFKHVYVFSPGKASLSLTSAIAVSETGLKNPASTSGHRLWNLSTAKGSTGSSAAMTLWR